MERIKEIILCKYGEVILKGANRSAFEAQLLRDVRRRAALSGQFDVRAQQSTVYVEPLDEAAEEAVDEVYERLKKVFGFVALCKAAVCEKDMDAILNTARAYLPEKLAGVSTFKCESRRSDKRFPYSSL